MKAFFDAASSAELVAVHASGIDAGSQAAIHITEVIKGFNPKFDKLSGEELAGAAFAANGELTMQQRVSLASLPMKTPHQPSPAR